MLSIKSAIAAVALGVALLVVPATANAKVIHKTATKLHATKAHPKKLHRTHTKHTPLHASKSKAHTLSHTKTAHTPVTAGWKHHRSI